MRSRHDLSRPSGAAAEPRERFPWGYLGAFLFGTALISTFIWFQIEGERQTALAQWQARITTIAEGRAHLLSDWFKGGAPMQTCSPPRPQCAPSCSTAPVK